MKPAGYPTNGYLTMDLMRFLAALAVLWNHVWGMVVPAYAPAYLEWRSIYQTAGLGPDAVRIFFVISGYWITASILKKTDAGAWSWFTYAIDRLSRLWIVMIPVLLVGLALDWSGRYLFEFPRYADFDFIVKENVDVGTTLTPQAFFGNLIFLQNIYVPPFGSNNPLWSLTNEFWYYVWFPALFLVFRKKVSVMTLLAIATIILFIHTNVTEGFLVWLLGSLVYVATDRLGARLRGLSGWLRYGVVAGTFAIFLATLAFVHLSPISWLADGLIIGVGFSLLLATVIALDVGIPKLLHPLAVYGARASFSLYLVHFPVLLFLASTLLGGHVFRPGAVAFAVAIGMAALLVAIAWAFSLVTEKHTGWMRKRLTVALLRPRTPQPKPDVADV